MTTNTNIGKSNPSARGSENRAPAERRFDAPTPSRAAKNPTHDQIAERARAVWQAKGCPSGLDEQNWREAEAQLRAELSRS